MPCLLLKTTAICLDIRPFSQTSQMVTWFSEDYGRLTTPIRGALRTKSAFLGRYDVGYTCELVFYAYESNLVHNIREVYPLNMREGLRGTWRAALAASYVTDLTLRTIQPSLANTTLFHALENFLDIMSTCPSLFIPIAILWYETFLLHATGTQPDFTLCSQCAPDKRPLFSIEEGRFICEHRPTRQRHPATIVLHNDMLELFELFTRLSLTTLLERFQHSQRKDALGRLEPFPGIFGLRRFLGVFLAQHLELPAGPRRTLFDTLLTGH